MSKHPPVSEKESIASQQEPKNYLLALKTNISREEAMTFARYMRDKAREEIVNRFMGIPCQDEDSIFNCNDFKAAPGSVVTLIGYPQVIFKPTSIVVGDGSNVEAFEVIDIKVGRNSQLVSAARISLDCIDKFKGQLKFDTAPINCSILIVLENKSSKAQEIPSIMVVGTDGNQEG